MPSSATVKYLFSPGKYIMRAKMSCLSDDNINMLMFTKAKKIESSSSSKELEAGDYNASICDEDNGRHSKSSKSRAAHTVKKMAGRQRNQELNRPSL